MTRPVLAAIVLIAMAATAARAQVPASPEFRVNANTTGRQMAPALASDARGNFVVVWSDEGVSDGGDGVLARRFQPSGRPTDTNEFRVNSYTTDAQWGGSVASDGTGRLVITWQSGSSSGTQDGDQLGIYAQRYDPAATPEGGEFKVNTYTTGSQQAARGAFVGNGHFVLVWTSQNGSLASQDGHLAGVFAQRYDSDGVPQGSEFRVNTSTLGAQHAYGVVSDPAGNFVVAWQGPDGDLQGVFGKRYDSSGVPQGGEFQINTYTTSSQTTVDLSADAAGNFIVVWMSSEPSLGHGDVFARRYDGQGAAQGPEFLVNSYTTRHQGEPAIAADPGGSFLVAWVSVLEDDDTRGIFARMFDAGGTPVGDEFRIGSTTVSLSDPRVVALGHDNFVVAWTDFSGPDFGDVKAQRFGPDLVFRDGFESGDTSAWSETAADGGDLSVSGTAALNATGSGMEAVVDDTAGLYVQDDTPLDENRYRARFYLDPNGFDPGESQGHLRTRVFIAFEEAPARRLVAVVLRRKAGAYGLMARVRLDDDRQRSTAFFPISDDPHFVELDWRRATAPGAGDGSLELQLNGNLVATLSGLDNGLGGVDFVRLGMLSAKAGASGTPYLDEFESRRLSAIGP